MSLCLFFFFKQKTAYEMRISDWSSDVCSSDLSENIDPRIFGGDSAFPFQHLSDLGIHDQPDRVVENEDIGLVTVLGLEPRPFRDEVGRELVDRKSVV